MARRVATIVGVLGLALLLTACEDGPTLIHQSADGRTLPKIEGPGLVASSKSPIPDVPMPVGFLYIESKSRSTAVGNLRSVAHVYQGRATRNETAAFYREQLPTLGWQRLSDEMAGNTQVLRFLKDKESVDVRVVQDGPVSTVRVNLQEQSDSPVTNLP